MEWLKYYREKAGLSMNKLSEMIGVQLNTVWRWESERASPSVDMAKALSKILGISESELLNGPDSRTWELKLVVNKGKKEGGILDMTGATSAATLEIGDFSMGITLSAPFALWEDDAKFEELVEQLRRKRRTGLKTRREDWD